MDIMKWIYSFVLLLATIGWAVFTVLICKDAVDNPTSINVIETAGASVLMGALITWNGLVIQHWFRKKNPEEGK